MRKINQELDSKLSHLIMRKQSDDGSIDISDQKTMKNEILHLIEAEIYIRENQFARTTIPSYYTFGNHKIYNQAELDRQVSAALHKYKNRALNQGS